MSSKSQADAEMQDEQKGSSDSESDNEIDKHQADEVAVHKINGRSIKDFSEVRLLYKLLCHIICVILILV